jgi:hypothetical protein
MLPSILPSACPAILSGCLLLATAAPAGAQSFNIRLTGFGPVPSPSFGAATGQTGVWNAVLHSTSPTAHPPTRLVGLGGEPTNASATIVGCDPSPCSFTGYGPDIAALYSADVDGTCSTTLIILDGLEPGHYVLNAYGTQCDTYYSSVAIWIPNSSYYTVADMAGDYNGSFAPVLLADDHFDLLPGYDSVYIHPQYAPGVSALQICRFEPPVTYCTAKVNSQGCQAHISASGNISASPTNWSHFILEATEVIADAPGVFFFGQDRDLTPFLGGFLCVKSPTVSVAALAGSSSTGTCTGTLSLDFSAYLASPASWQYHIFAGTILDGQFWYRDPHDPQGFGSATSNAIEFAVTP